MLRLLSVLLNESKKTEKATLIAQNYFKNNNNST